MNKLNITIENTKCGLGDMLHRIDVVYRFCTKENHNFFMPDVRSDLHNNKYDEVLGISNYKPNRTEWMGDVEIIKMKDFFENIKDYDSTKLYSIQFDHSFARTFYSNNQLHKQERLDYSHYIPVLNTNSPLVIDVLIHLRLGDSYIYSLSNGNFYHARERKLYCKSEINRNELSEQWNIDEVFKIIEHCRFNDLVYKVHCDGIQSVIRSVRWTKDDQITAHKNEIEEAAKLFEKQFLELVGNSSMLIYDNPEIEPAIDDIIRTKLLVHTVGGFATGINKFLNPNPCKTISFKKYLKEILV